MSQLPPRAPTMAAPDLSCWKPPPTIAANGFDNPSWINDVDFVQFSAVKRRDRRIPHDDDGGEFERFDEEARLILSMFNNELVKDASTDGPTNSTSSAGNGSTNVDKKRCRVEEKRPVAAVKSEHEEVESSTCKNDECEDKRGPPVAVSPPSPFAGAHETVTDPKRVKRILANRQSARRSRVRKLQYIAELERSLTTLQTEVAMLSPRVAYMHHQRMILNDDNSALKSKIAALAQDNIFKDAHQDALKTEIERLKQVYQQQQQQTTGPDADNNTTTTTPKSSPSLHHPAGVPAPLARSLAS